MAEAILAGRRLLPPEIPLSDEFLKTLYHHGFLQIFSGIENDTCSRCGSRELAEYQCLRCKRRCQYCRHCLQMGAVKSCSPLIGWKSHARLSPPPRLTPRWDGELSHLQTLAAEALARSAEAGQAFLLWAVCGAGKTESLYPMITEAILAGKRVGLAAPRTDVVIELGTRLSEVFHEVDPLVLYGGSTERDRLSALTVATTHQLLRYYHAFDVLVIDEIDAFPFTADQSLERAARLSLKPEGSLVYLTATPDGRLQRDFRRGKLGGFKIPMRFHGHPLPEPVFKWLGDWEKMISDRKFPSPLFRWLKNAASGDHPILIFVPSIKVLHILSELLPDDFTQADFVHSADPERHKKVTAFRTGVIKILFTTTILERGVTIPRVQVAVFGSDHEVFDEPALVQISGRAGRSASHPDGEVVWFHYGATLAMYEARDHIRQMNKDRLVYLNQTKE